ncbi:hypothetical protein [Gorillibacterium sp. CAU 1737]|uniref:hypothetical protein n=1 Tax=Gorillibacterium sp. CAU 1737 TaxID=3140362 RepID=UPI0032606F5B
MNAKQIIEQNRKLQKELNEENGKYYTDLVAYTRLKGSLLYKEQQVEEILLVILQDLLDAQRAGIGASDYFGKHPKQVADAMMRELPTAPFLQQIRYVLYVFGIYALFTILPGLVFPDESFDIGALLVSFLITILFVKMIVVEIRQSIYRETGRKGKFVMIGCACLGLASIVVAKILLPALWPVKLEGALGIGVVAVLLALATWFTLRKGNEFFRPFLIVAYASGVLAIVSRIPKYAAFWKSTGGLLVIVVWLAGSLIWFFYRSYRQINRE